MSFLGKISVLAFAFLVLGGLGHARAQYQTPIALTTGSNLLAYDGLSFSVTSCSFTQNGTSTGCSAANDVLEITQSIRGSPTLSIFGSGSGSNGSSALACASCSNATSLVFSLKLARAGGKPSTVTDVSNAITGSANGSTNVSASLVNAAHTAQAANVTVSSPTASAAVTNALSSGGGTMSFSVSLGLNAFNTGTLQLGVDALQFSPAPEPASIALFASGLACLAAVRRRFKRDRPLAADAA